MNQSAQHAIIMANLTPGQLKARRAGLQSRAIAALNRTTISTGKVKPQSTFVAKPIANPLPLS